MAVGTLNWVFIALSFFCAIPACGLMWRVFDSEENIKDDYRRQADYEVCGFLFYWFTSFLALYKSRDGSSGAVLRTISIGVLVYLTIAGTYTSFQNLNNLRIVDQSNDRYYYWPLTFNGPIDRVQQRKFFGGLILGYFTLLFGLLAQASEFNFGKAGGSASLLFFVGTIISIPGVVVSWSSSGAPTYPDFANGSANNAVNYAIQGELFQITTFTIVQWLVLSVGLFSATEDLVSSSGWIFGLGNLFAPVAYFFIQQQSPADKNFSWAGPILCWVGCAVLAAAAAVAPVGQKKEASV